MSAAAVRGLLSRRCLATANTRPTTAAAAAAAAAIASEPSASSSSSSIMAGPTTDGRQQRRALHCSAPLSARRRPRFKSVQAEKMGLTTPKKVDEFTAKHFPDYTEADLAKLAETSSWIAAGLVQFGPTYREGYAKRHNVHLSNRVVNNDLSTVMPIVDKRARPKGAPDTRARFMSADEFTDDFLEWLQGFVPADVNLEGMSEDELAAAIDKYAPSNLDVFKYFNERSSMTDGGRGSNSAEAPALMDKVPGVAGRYKRQSDAEDRGMDEAGVYQELKKMTGLTVPQMIEMPSKFLVQRSVVNQTRLGKIQSWHVMCLVGNNNGRIGLGEAKSTELMTARTKSRLQAIKNMMPIRRYENRTIFGKAEAKVSGTIVQMFSRPPGFGLRVSHRIFEICRLAGIKDLSARIPRSRCPMNTVKATLKCLTEQVDPEAIAIGRGRKMVDVRKVYYGGAVY
ncbi:37S ribosomal protein S5 [Magnaporthiopsis poae ATCC 64411]|uniref:Small ribosomal subunit protein uS5m n=1 Tax=Magnaporthiopsis poae (strain ATCC 64411 / 73-15) TaxID=644358 RepID=A0A0C4DJX8_MAGP6|nr:37S ribosomal protein S5 [Magnaporthiopsis poae ATCC 64411]